MLVDFLSVSGYSLGMIARLYTASELAKRLGCAAVTIRRAAESHRIGSIATGRWLFEASDIPKLRKHCRTSKGNPNFSSSDYQRKTALKRWNSCTA